MGPHLASCWSPSSCPSPRGGPSTLSSLSHPQATARLHPLGTSCPSCRSLLRGEPSTFPRLQLFSLALPVGLCLGPQEGTAPAFPPPSPFSFPGSSGPQRAGLCPRVHRPPGPTAECREDKWLHGKGLHARTTSHYYCMYTCIGRQFSAILGGALVLGSE